VAVIAEPPAHRERCMRCRRPRVVCYCAALPRLETRTKVVILQHPRERDMPIGTARMASLCLPQSELHVGVSWDAHAPLARALANPAQPPILLYPGPGAKDILREPPSGPVTLVVVDGTWTQAKTVVRDNPVLQALPRYAFATPELSKYRIRKEPDDRFVSTIEALMHVLGALEGDAERFRALLEPLNAMVETQIAYKERDGKSRWRKPRVGGPPPPRLPEQLTARWGDLVCLVAESNAWPYQEGVKREDELLQVVAVRVATGERLDVIARPDGELAPSTCFHIELDEATLRGGVTKAELMQRLAAFVRKTDVVCVWGAYSLELVRAAGMELPRPALDLRDAAYRLTNKKIGSLEQYAMAVGEGEGKGEERGRGRRRLAMLGRVLRAWKEMERGQGQGQGQGQGSEMEKV
jgi:DTW domain-containing protein YfiP